MKAILDKLEQCRPAASRVNEIGRSEPEQTQSRAVLAMRHRQRHGRNLLAGLQGKEGGAVRVGVGRDERVSPVVQCIDHRLGEIRSRLHDRGIRAEQGGLRLHRGQCLGDVAERGVDIGVGLELTGGRGNSQPA